MRKKAYGIVAIIALGFASPALAEDPAEQTNEQQGSEAKVQSGSGKSAIGPKSIPYLAPGAENSSNLLEPLDDPDTPDEGDAVDNALPGEGPQDLVGPDDDDSLPE
jgi:hypothetical protein